MTIEITDTETGTQSQSRLHSSNSVWLTAAAQIIYGGIIEALPHLANVPFRDSPKMITEDVGPFEMIAVIESAFHIGSRNVTGELIEKLKRIDIEAFGTPVTPEVVPSSLVFTGSFKFLRAICFRDSGEAMFRFDIAAYGTRK